MKWEGWLIYASFTLIFTGLAVLILNAVGRLCG